MRDRGLRARPDLQYRGVRTEDLNSLFPGREVLKRGCVTVDSADPSSGRGRVGKSYTEARPYA